MPSAKVTSKGQITIPVKVRRAMGITTGTEVMFFETGSGRVEMRAKTGSILDLEGCVPKLDHVVTIEEMDEAISEYVTAMDEATKSNVPIESADDEAA